MASDSSTPTEIVSRMVKSNHFRVVYSEGVWGGISPKGLVNLTFFNERHALPRKVKTLLTEVAPGRAIPTGLEVIESEEGTVREMEVEVVMTVEEAQNFATWLTQTLEEYTQFMSADSSDPA